MGSYYTLSVHQFVDFLLRQGDIDNRVYNQETMRVGTKLHSAFQSEQGSNYLSEVALSGSIEVEQGTISLQGRCDGIIIGGAYPIIDEIKSSVQDLKQFALTQEEWHLGQALCYAYMYLKQHGGSKIGVRLTYISQITSTHKWVRNFTYSDQEVFTKVEDLAREYFGFMESVELHAKERDESVKELKFPFGEFRKGQRELSRLVYGAIKNRKILFSEAPTGIGKTMATLYPAVKSFQKDKVDRIFYFTAKTTGAQAAYDAMTGLYEHGLIARDSYLMAKEKICLNPGSNCNPDECPFAKDYYSRLKGNILLAIHELTRFDPQSIFDYCRNAEICPFEFQLDLSLFSDIIIADYNYFFDPMVHLERYFDDDKDASHFVALIDEAHNLVKRGRDMYSAELTLSLASEAHSALKGEGYKSLKNAINKIKKALKALTGIEDYVPDDLTKALESFKRAKQKLDKQEQEQQVPKHKEKPGPAYIEFSRELTKWNRIKDEFFGPSYKMRIQGPPNNGVILYCLDPSPFLKDTLDKVRSSILFSATLTPMPYYQESIAGATDFGSLSLSSPFPKENLKVMVAPKPTTRYKERDKWYGDVASYLNTFVKAKMGNYFLYFPSYEYLEKVYPLLDFGDADVLLQERQMGDVERSVFLAQFLPSPKKTTVGLLVLGGAFSEGIDLVDDRLIGVAVVGIGLPQVGDDTEDIRTYYEQKQGDGYAYAYLYPGMNKVFQAIGRVIRSETDKGAALLIDSRFLSSDFRPALSRLYPQMEIVMDKREIQEILQRFYQKKLTGRNGN